MRVTDLHNRGQLHTRQAPLVVHNPPGEVAEQGSDEDTELREFSRTLCGTGPNRCAQFLADLSVAAYQLLRDRHEEFRR